MELVGSRPLLDLPEGELIMANEATIVRAPGHPEHLKAKVIPGLGKVPARDGRGELAVITWGDGELAVVPSRCVVMGAVDLVKRFEVEYDWYEDLWGVRHAFDGPFVRWGTKAECEAFIARKTWRLR